MAMRAKFYVCGRMLITKGPKVLMGKEVSPEDAEWFMWETPGGGLRPGETIEDCLAREALEEIGIEIRILNEIPRFQSSSEIPPTQYDPDVYWLLVYCRCESEGEPNLFHASDTEFSELRYASQEEFNLLLREGRVSYAEQKCLPEIMVDLGLWKEE